MAGDRIHNAIWGKVPPDRSSGPYEKPDTEKIEGVDDPDIEADNKPTINEVEAHLHGGYYNFKPIADLELEDWRGTEKRLVRTLDCTLMPILWITYLNNYLDRTNISQAVTAGLDEDANLQGDDFNNALMMLTVGYMLAQLPSNLLLTRVRPSIYLPTTVMIWSTISACTAAVSNTQQLFAVRFFLGITEAPMFPGVGWLISTKRLFHC